MVNNQPAVSNKVFNTFSALGFLSDTIFVTVVRVLAALNTVLTGVDCEIEGTLSDMIFSF